MSVSKEAPTDKRLDVLEERIQAWEAVLRFRCSGMTALTDRCWVKRVLEIETGAP